ncbi:MULTISPECIES: circadian clock KaiB family protein [unclassified Roseofilum]|uniref:circadian clock KaiB family protein n=1 Tax=unclassified Roseofilum TaxID=2620099 RepID=UPI001B203AD3|nr:MULTISPECIES: circadian clock KaiB family protein [unclassified Roseofilum]MBP0010872.1 circadian clock KaiB family protein [Roseofilum sp. Belize Diploria]MBP0035414.1 circadian clock KaiB family protein [Roseofilum sp. Belize BBD 4]
MMGSESFKAIALFTPGGDIVYCIDPRKRNRWHIDLCAKLQTLLDLSAAPHFLVPCYTATLDRWIDPHTQQTHCVAEAYPLVFDYAPLLNALFGLEVEWKRVSCDTELCDPIAIASYYEQFPQLWEDHDWVVRVQHRSVEEMQPDLSLEEFNPHGYIFRLFVSGNHNTTERLLHKVHLFLEQSLSQPYTLKVIDILKHPDLAEQDQVLATPTLLRVWPQPMRRVVGEIEYQEQLFRLIH